MVLRRQKDWRRTKTGITQRLPTVAVWARHLAARRITGLKILLLASIFRLPSLAFIRPDTCFSACGVSGLPRHEGPLRVAMNAKRNQQTPETYVLADHHSEFKDLRLGEHGTQLRDEGIVDGLMVKRHALSKGDRQTFALRELPLFFRVVELGNT